MRGSFEGANSIIYSTLYLDFNYHISVRPQSVYNIAPRAPFDKFLEITTMCSDCLFAMRSRDTERRSISNLSNDFF